MKFSKVLSLKEGSAAAKIAFKEAWLEASTGPLPDHQVRYRGFGNDYEVWNTQAPWKQLGLIKLKPQDEKVTAEVTLYEMPIIN